ncbi:MAG: radical SAM protein [Verrucomicrobiales bacterium]|nr:radical SAM protein [Verrucomicrobiales bacterium]
MCAECIRTRFDAALPLIRTAHATARHRFGLPAEPPTSATGHACKLCSHGCVLSPGSAGYCGLRPGHRARAKVSWYYDPLPTNCVADFVCPGGTGCGYPKFAYRPGPERGYNNLAVFYEACTFDCLYCQNWTFRHSTRSAKTIPPEALADAVEPSTACVCFFGGDPTPQLPHSIRAARLALQRNRGRILRICWETNGNMHPALLDQMIDIALESGGCIKFDLKAWDERIHIALTGVSNKRTLENFARAAQRVRERPEPPLLIASTLLVPGYVDTEEVGRIAQFIARLDPAIPYSLLAFHPDFVMTDLPPTSLAHAERAFAAAHEAGLKRIRLGNQHLLWRGDYHELH